MEHETKFLGLTVVEWQVGQALQNPSSHAFRISTEYEAEVPWVDTFDAFLRSPGAELVQAFLVGPWGDVATGQTPEPMIEALVGARARLPALRGLFFGDITAEESEISWIHQGDLSPLLSAYPALAELRVRGNQGLSLGRIDHPKLERLIVETGGLDRSVVQQVMTANLPSLTHLELWLGDDGYGANTTPDDFTALLNGSHLPKLQTLALRNCHYADDLARAIAASSVLGRIHKLDLSLGTLTDAGAEALLAAPALRSLRALDLHHHYISQAVVKRLEALPFAVDVSDEQAPNVYKGEVSYYVAVSE